MSHSHIDMNALVKAALGVPNQYGHAVYQMLDQLNQDVAEAPAWYRQLLQFLDVGLSTQGPVEVGTNLFGQSYAVIQGLSLLGKTEATLLRNQRFNIGRNAWHCLTRQGLGSYDEQHRLVPGKRYPLALVRWWDIKDARPFAPTTAHVLEHFQANGYSTQGLYAGMVPRLREVFTNPMMDELRLRYIAVLHEPIRDDSGHPCFLVVERDDAYDPMVSAWSTLHEWPRDGAFVYLAEMKTL